MWNVCPGRLPGLVPCVAASTATTATCADTLKPCTRRSGASDCVQGAPDTSTPSCSSSHRRHLSSLLVRRHSHNENSLRNIKFFLSTWLIAPRKCHRMKLSLKVHILRHDISVPQPVVLGHYRRALMHKFMFYSITTTVIFCDLILSWQ